jgi:ATP-binding cassette, subfamily F, member 3
MILLSLQGVKKSFGTNEVLRDASLVLQEGQRMGLVGVNGCGKSTLMKIIAGLETADDGTITMQKGIRLGYLAQQGMVDENKTVLQEMESVFEPVMRMEEQLRELEHQMADAVEDEALLHRLGSRYDQLTRDFEKSNGFGWRSTVQGVLAGLGFRKEQQDQPARLLSGGERTRLCLARMLLTEPDLLLLDEPTNHLDLKSIAWLEDYLHTYRGAVLLVSHDRYFMDHVCDRMCELLLGVTECYDGNYTAYMGERTQRFEIRMKAYEMQQKEIARQQAIIARYRRFNREKSIRAAESREKRLEKMERLEKPQDESAIHFHFDCRRRTGEDVLMIDELKKGFDGRTLFDHVKMHLRAGDRVALIGDNGVGKSTLFKCLIGEEKPDGGTIRLGAGVDIGYYDQHQAHLHENKTVLDEVWDDFRRLDQTEVRGALGLFLFTGDDVLMPISTLSGGEKGRVALTKLMLHKDNLLLLDEPTNHLDMDSREVLEDALEGFPGTILAISHDRYFINRFANKVCVLENGGIREYLGNYDDYFEKINRLQEPDGDAPQITRTAMDKEKRRSREEEKRLREHKAALKQAEEAIAKAEEEAADMEQRLAQPDTYQNADLAAELARAYQQKKDEIDRLYQRWEELESETV